MTQKTQENLILRQQWGNSDQPTRIPPPKGRRIPQEMKQHHAKTRRSGLESIQKAIRFPALLISPHSQASACRETGTAGLWVGEHQAELRTRCCTETRGLNEQMETWGSFSTGLSHCLHPELYSSGISLEERFLGNLVSLGGKT